MAVDNNYVTKIQRVIHINPIIFSSPVYFCALQAHVW